MIQRGIVSFGLDYGRCPKWLFERMARLAGKITEVIVEEYGPEEFVKRISDPVWFQALSCVIGMDWNSSGTTTITTGALKKGLKGLEKDLGVFICGGKGKTSRQTPEEIENWGGVLGLPAGQVNNLIYNSKMAAKIDSCCLQDNYQIYHHSFFFSLTQKGFKKKIGSWAVIQQGMNVYNQTARRYHWYSEKITDLVCEPHSGIITQLKNPTLNLVAKQSEKNREVTTELVQGNYQGLIKDIQILRRHSSQLSKMISLRFKQNKITLLRLENREFYWHPVVLENFLESKYLKKILYRICEQKPRSYEQLLSLKGVGPKTIRALSLVSEVIYGAKPSYEDPARYSFCVGGKDGTPFFVRKDIYDNLLDIMEKGIKKSKISIREKQEAQRRLYEHF